MRPVWPAIGVSLVLCSAYQLLSRAWGALDAWTAVGLSLVILIGGTLLAAWLRLDVPGLGAGAMLTYCWVGMVKAWQTGGAALVEQTVLVVIALAVVVLAARRHSRVAARA